MITDIITGGEALAMAVGVLIGIVGTLGWLKFSKK